MPVREQYPSFLRHNSKFYEDQGYGNKLLELSPGESARDLGTHPCGCNNVISSLKASDDALYTKIYDFTNFASDTWWIATGAEISNLGNYTQSDGESWLNQISSIEVSN